MNNLLTRCWRAFRRSMRASFAHQPHLCVNFHQNRSQRWFVMARWSMTYHFWERIPIEFCFCTPNSQKYLVWVLRILDFLKHGFERFSVTKSGYKMKAVIYSPSIGVAQWPPKVSWVNRGVQMVPKNGTTVLRTRTRYWLSFGVGWFRISLKMVLLSLRSWVKTFL